MAAGWEIGGGERYLIIFPIKILDSNRSQGEVRLGHHSVGSAVNRRFFTTFLLAFSSLLLTVDTERYKETPKTEVVPPAPLGRRKGTPATP